MLHAPLPNVRHLSYDHNMVGEPVSFTGDRYYEKKNTNTQQLKTRGDEHAHERFQALNQPESCNDKDHENESTSKQLTPTIITIMPPTNTPTTTATTINSRTRQQDLLLLLSQTTAAKKTRRPESSCSRRGPAAGS